ncbi:MAG: S-layer protein [Firmicutes bacterium]|nr:S-layer protein [Bacillota bacterium]
MKKNLVITLTLVFMLSIVGTAAAATTNPFVDVPANHWSYNAVKKLAAAGIIDGADGKFNGDKTLTRYEIAVIVAKAMGKEEQANAEQRALIEKLAAEYKADLESIGVRLKAVEGNVGQLSIQGSYLGFRYQRTTNAIWPLTAAHLDLLTHYNFDNTTTVTVEKEFQAAYKTNEYTQAWAGGDQDTDFETLCVDTALSKATKLTAGQFTNRPAYGMTYIGRMRGARLAFNGSHKLKTSLAYGQVYDTDRYYLAQVKIDKNYTNAALIDTRMPYASVDFTYAAFPNTNIKAAYQKISDWKTTSGTYVTVPASNFYELGFDTKLGNNFTLTAAGVKSSAAADNKSSFAELKYKQSMFWAVPHSYDVFVNYRKVPYNAVIGGHGGNVNDFYGDDNNSVNFKGTTIGFHYTPKRLTQLTCFYMLGKAVDDGADKKIFRTQFDFFF